MRLLLFVGLLFLSPVVVAQDAAYRFPQGLPGILDVRDFGAIGDGVADDTEAIQAAIDESGGKDTEFVGIVYLPAGTYRLTGALVANRGRRGSGVGPWIWGESRDSVVLKLDDQVNRGRKTDRATGREAAKANGDPPPLVEVGDPNDPDQIVKSVLQLHPFEEGVKTSANWFMRNIRRLTIDVGDNPEVDGIRYYASNDGILSDVSVIGAGAIGINCSMLGEAGPSLIQNVSVKGFATGIRSQWAYGQTMSGITIEDCRAAGLELAANVVGIENLTIRNTPQPFINTYPNNWHWWSARTAVIGATITSTEPVAQAAIFNKGKLLLRDASSTNYSQLLEGPPESSKGDPLNTAVETPDTSFFTSHPILDARGDTIEIPPIEFLPIEQAPPPVLSESREDWILVTDFGATADGKSDDSAAFQAAIDSAAESGATVLAIPPVPRTNRNWYTINETVILKSPIKHFFGIGWTRILGDGSIVVDQSSEPMIRFENTSAFGGNSVDFVHRAGEKTLVFDSVGIEFEGHGSGRIFITNAPMKLRLHSDAYRCWARHLNPETRQGGTGQNDALVANHGSDLWILGTKSEGDGRRFLTTNGGHTEIYGGYELTNKKIDPEDTRAIYTVRDATLFVGSIAERCFHNQPYPIKASGFWGDRDFQLDRENLRGKVWTNLWLGAPADD